MGLEYFRRIESGFRLVGDKATVRSLCDASSSRRGFGTRRQASGGEIFHSTDGRTSLQFRMGQSAPRTRGGVVINGRFLSQQNTGVQRYGRQIVEHLDDLFGTRSRAAQLIVPSGAPETMNLRHIEMRSSFLSGGAAWEQIALPMWRGRPTVNLCNTGPVISRSMIVCIHDCNVFDVPHSYTGAFRTYYRLLLPLLARSDAHISTVSRYSAECISKHLDVPLATIQVLPNGCEHARLWRPDRSLLNSSPQVAVRPYVLLVGSLTKHKNIALVLGLSAELKALGIRVKVVGATSSVFAGTSFEIDDNVDWLGRVSDDDLAFLLDRALCLAFPSKNEGFGLPVVEAMARGCPVVASDRSSLPEVCGGAALLADPDDPSAWLQHFRRLAKSEELRGDLAGRGRERSHFFSWRNSAEGYSEMISHYDR